MVVFGGFGQVQLVLVGWRRGFRLALVEWRQLLLFLEDWKAYFQQALVDLRTHFRQVLEDSNRGLHLVLVESTDSFRRALVVSLLSLLVSEEQQVLQSQLAALEEA